MPDTDVGAFFLHREDGARFCMIHRPPDRRPVKGSLLFVHPFAEEMNKSRRAVTAAARGLAEDGWCVLLMDLLGCGDSNGDFADATWSSWLADIRFAFGWLAEETGTTPVLWGLRLGGLLATESAKHLDAKPGLLLWQPMISGQLQLSQFLRIKVAGARIAADKDGPSTRFLLAELAAGRAVEVGGYTLSPSLALPMGQAELELHADYPGLVFWTEVASPGATQTLTPTSAAKVAQWSEAGIRLQTSVVPGLPFWQTQEIAECAALYSETRRLFKEYAG